MVERQGFICIYQWQNAHFPFWLKVGVNKNGKLEMGGGKKKKKFLTSSGNFIAASKIPISTTTE